MCTPYSCWKIVYNWPAPSFSNKLTTLSLPHIAAMWSAVCPLKSDTFTWPAHLIKRFMVLVSPVLAALVIREANLHSLMVPPHAFKYCTTPWWPFTMASARMHKYNANQFKQAMQTGDTVFLWLLSKRAHLANHTTDRQHVKRIKTQSINAKKLLSVENKWYVHYTEGTTRTGGWIFFGKHCGLIVCSREFCDTFEIKWSRFNGTVVVELSGHVGQFTLIRAFSIHNILAKL